VVHAHIQILFGHRPAQLAAVLSGQYSEADRSIGSVARSSWIGLNELRKRHCHMRKLDVCSSAMSVLMFDVVGVMTANAPIDGELYFLKWSAARPMLPSSRFIFSASFCLNSSALAAD